MKTQSQSSYPMTWGILFPYKGRTTKRDLNVIYRCGIWTVARSYFEDRPFVCHFPNKEAAITALKKVTGLFKEYDVLMITDAQFKQSSWNAYIQGIATSRQKKEIFVIK